jgi:uncharacterized DUF497 family protein
VRISRFEWDARNVGHVTRHKVRPNEAEEAFRNEPLFRKGRRGFRTVYGRTGDGRYLFVVYVRKRNGVRIITARDMTPAERRYYRRERRG